MTPRARAAIAIVLLLGVTAGIAVAWSPPGWPAAAVATPDVSAAASPSSTPAPIPVATPTPAATPVPELDAAERLTPALQLALDSMRAREAIPGVSVTVVFDDGSAWHGVSGFADVKNRVAVTPDTAFAVGSISKTFTAALVLDLVEDGRIRLEDSAREYVPNLAIDRAITIRQLLDHTSGLHDFFFSPGIDKALRADRSAIWTAARTFRYVKKPYFLPGKGWHYSNTNYFVLGLIAEKVGGASVAEQLRARYLEPLALTRTFYEVTEKPRGPVAHGYRFAGSKKTLPPIDLSDGTGVTPFRSVVTAAGAAGSMASNSDDIARWARSLYSGDVLDSATLDLMLDEVASTSTYKPRIPYGMGVQAITVGGYGSLGHSGRLLGSQAVVRHFPDVGVTIAVLTNQNRSDPSKILVQLLKIAAPPPPSPTPPIGAMPTPIGTPNPSPVVPSPCTVACPTP
jgi:D-alanyl-D-alanine carboxypeptidase